MHFHIEGHIWRSGFWIRVNKKILILHRQKTHHVYFSERAGFYKWHYWWPICWCFRQVKS